MPDDVGSVTIFRYNPDVDREARYDRFEEVPIRGMRVLDVLRYIYENLDSTLSFRCSCRDGRCASCAISVNGKVVLACKKFAEKEMTIEPPGNYPVIKDLVVDFKRDKSSVH